MKPVLHPLRKYFSRRTINCLVNARIVEDIYYKENALRRILTSEYAHLEKSVWGYGAKSHAEVKKFLGVNVPPHDIFLSINGQKFTVSPTTRKTTFTHLGIEARVRIRHFKQFVHKGGKKPMGLRRYQIIGRDFLAARNVALLADGMRLGKSAQVIRAFESLNLKNVLIVCPASARYVWSEELKKWSVQPHQVHVGYPSTKLAAKLEGICIAGYTRPEDDLLEQDWDLVVLDECHYLKNSNSQRTQKIYRIIKHVPRVWWLSGTPMMSHAAELWPMLRMAGECPYTYDQFVRKFCNGYQPRKGAFRITGHKKGAEQEIKQMLDGFMLRRTMEEIFPELPRARVNFYPMEKTKNTEFDAKIDDCVRQSVIGGRLPTDVTMATWRRMTGLAKVRGVLDVIKHDLQNGLDKIVLFAWHTEVISQLRVGLDSWGAVVLDGGTPAEMRGQAVNRFSEDATCRVFIGNIQAASEAIDLSVACNVGFVELDWTPTRNDQAAARVIGANQKRPVDVRVFTLEESADRMVAKALLRKSKNLMEVLCDGQ